MKKNILYSLILLAFVACGGGGDDTGETPQVNKDYLSVPPSQELLGDGQTVDIKIIANCSWTISQDADWLTVTPMSGSGEQTVTIAAMKNSTGSERMAILTVQGGTLPARRITVTQKASSDTPAQKYISVNTTSMEFDKDGGSQNFEITSNTSWTITGPDWCTLSSTSGSGNATITVTATKNDKTQQRTGKVNVNGEGVSANSIDITQKPADNTHSEPGAGDNLPPS